MRKEFQFPNYARLPKKITTKSRGTLIVIMNNNFRSCTLDALHCVINVLSLLGIFDL